MRIIFMGTPEFALPALKALCENHEVIAVYTQCPKPCGKGLKIQKSPIHQEAEKRGIPVYTPKNFKEPGTIQTFQNLNADVAVVCAYGLLLPEAILNAPQKGCINIHASLLPCWRGAAPIQRAIQNGDKYSGITIMQMDKGLDTGDMLLKEEVAILPTTTGQELENTLSLLGAKLIIQALKENPTPQKQPEIGSYAKKIEKQETLIDFNNEAEFIFRTINAFYPYPACYFIYKGVRIKVLKASVVECQNTPGEIIDEKNLIIGTKNKGLCLEILQKEGKKPMDKKTFLMGFSFQKGDKIGL